MLNPLTKIIYSQEVKKLILERIRKYNVSVRALCEDSLIPYSIYMNYMNKDIDDKSIPPLKLLKLLEILGVKTKIVLVQSDPDEDKINRVKEENILNR